MQTVSNPLHSSGAPLQSSPFVTLPHPLRGMDAAGLQLHPAFLHPFYNLGPSLAGALRGGLATSSSDPRLGCRTPDPRDKSYSQKSQKSFTIDAILGADDARDLTSMSTTITSLATSLTTSMVSQDSYERHKVKPVLGSRGEDLLAMRHNRLPSHPYLPFTCPPSLAFRPHSSRGTYGRSLLQTTTAEYRFLLMIRKNQRPLDYTATIELISNRHHFNEIFHNMNNTILCSIQLYIRDIVNFKWANSQGYIHMGRQIYIELFEGHHIHMGR